MCLTGERRRDHEKEGGEARLMRKWGRRRMSFAPEQGRVARRCTLAGQTLLLVV